MAEHDLAEVADGSREKAQGFGVLRLQDEKANVSGDKASGSSAVRAAGDGRWQVPIFALARKASETFSGSIHALPKVSEHREHRTALPEEWTAKGELHGGRMPLKRGSGVPMHHVPFHTLVLQTRLVF